MNVGVDNASRGGAARRAVDLFSGSGAVTAALTRNDYEVVVAIDNDPVACRTYAANHKDVLLLREDIVEVDPTTHEAFTAIGHIDLLVVCAPCQPFSSQNRRRGEHDHRASLLLEAVKFARALQPRCILFENVPGHASPANLAILERLREELLEAGYTLSEPRRIDAGDLGVPQRRIRCVMVAAPDAATAANFATWVLPNARTTVRDAIGDLRPLENGARDLCDPLHYARVHRDVVLRRLECIPADGGSRSSLPAELELVCHRGRPTSFSDVYGRMVWDGVSPTLTTGCTDLTRGRFAHPAQDRAITLREAALLQTFPPDYRFEGTKSQIARQIGNAVPVGMVEALLPVIDALISEGVPPHGA